MWKQQLNQTPNLSNCVKTILGYVFKIMRGLTISNNSTAANLSLKTQITLQYKNMVIFNQF